MVARQLSHRVVVDRDDDDCEQLKQKENIASRTQLLTRSQARGAHGNWSTVIAIEELRGMVLRSTGRRWMPIRGFQKKFQIKHAIATRMQSAEALGKLSNAS